MSGIETAVQSILTTVILVQPCQLDIISQTTIATWAALKILVGEHNTQDEAITPVDARQNFMEQ
jgi:hypothetical protein